MIFLCGVIDVQNDSVHYDNTVDKFYVCMQCYKYKKFHILSNDKLQKLHDFSPHFVDLLKKMLAINGLNRATLKDLIKHPFFSNCKIKNTLYSDYIDKTHKLDNSNIITIPAISTTPMITDVNNTFLGKHVTAAYISYSEHDIFKNNYELIQMHNIHNTFKSNKLNKLFNFSDDRLNTMLNFIINMNFHSNLFSLDALIHTLLLVPHTIQNTTENKFKVASVTFYYFMSNMYTGNYMCDQYIKDHYAKPKQLKLFTELFLDTFRSNYHTLTTINSIMIHIHYITINLHKIGMGKIFVDELRFYLIKNIVLFALVRDAYYNVTDDFADGDHYTAWEIIQSLYHLYYKENADSLHLIECNNNCKLMDIVVTLNSTSELINKIHRMLIYARQLVTDDNNLTNAKKFL